MYIVFPVATVLPSSHAVLVFRLRGTSSSSFAVPAALRQSLEPLGASGRSKRGSNCRPNPIHATSTTNPLPLRSAASHRLALFLGRFLFFSRPHASPQGEHQGSTRGPFPMWQYNRVSKQLFEGPECWCRRLHLHSSSRSPSLSSSSLAGLGMKDESCKKRAPSRQLQAATFAEKTSKCQQELLKK